MDINAPPKGDSTTANIHQQGSYVLNPNVEQPSAAADPDTANLPVIFPFARPSTRTPANVTIHPVTPITLPSFRRLISLLLPIRYPDKFFADSIADPTPSSLARVAVWHHSSRSAKRKRLDSPLPPNVLEKRVDSLKKKEDLCRKGEVSASDSQNQSNGTFPTNQRPTTDRYNDEESLDSQRPRPEETTVVAGIQCRLESLPYHPSSLPTLTKLSRPNAAPPTLSSITPESSQYIYIQTLALLSPYRNQGIATALLNAIISTICTETCYQGTKGLYAHVWEANEEALKWYRKRGFMVGDGVVEGYYRKLRPGGARVVWRGLGVEDFLRLRQRKDSVREGDG